MKKCNKGHEYENKPRCPSCHKEYNKKWHAENEEHIKEYKTTYNKINEQKTQEDNRKKGNKL